MLYATSGDGGGTLSISRSSYSSSYSAERPSSLIKSFYPEHALPIVTNLY